MVPRFLGRLLTEEGVPVGTCFQVAPGWVVTAWHVVVDAVGEQVAEAFAARGGFEPDRGPAVRVEGLRPGSPPPQAGRVRRYDELQDVAVIQLDDPLVGSVPGVTASDGVLVNTDVLTTGHAVVPDSVDHTYRFLQAPGKWSGGGMRDDAVPLCRMSSPDLLRGMSGAPVVRTADGSVVGMVSARYNSSDGWLRDSVWVVRTEDITAVLQGLVDVPVTGTSDRDDAVDLVLRIEKSRVRLLGAGVDTVEAFGPLPPGLRYTLADARRVREGGSGLRGPEAGPAAVVTSMREVGRRLGEVFLTSSVQSALREVMVAARATSTPVHLGVEVTTAGDDVSGPDGLSGLPWEALPDPLAGEPLALHPLVTMYRRRPAPPPRSLAGPLRIVVAITAPTRGGGAVLDYERELRNVLAAVKGARAGDAQVQIVPFATATAIHAALAGGDVHVLHLSGHGRPGILVLEDDSGMALEVTAQDFVRAAVPAGCMPPVISLAACSTGARDETGGSVAIDFLDRGASAVVAAETSITDRYATHLFARIYHELAHAPRPDVVGAAARARRTVRDQLATSDNPRDRAVAGMDEWSVVTVISPTAAAIVFDPDLPQAPPSRALPAHRTIAGLPTREPGEFVGRRGEQRTLPTVLRSRHVAGVVLLGIGGIGKTTLSTEVIRRSLEDDPNLDVITATGSTDTDAILRQVAATLRPRLLMSAPGSTSETLLQALVVAERPDVPWQDRLSVLREHVLDVRPALLVLDNFEDNLVDELALPGAPGARGCRPRQLGDAVLADFLAALVLDPGRLRLLITCRYPFTVPGGTERRLHTETLGPLTLAETQKLAWSLPQMNRLPDADVHHLWLAVGGHPRTLEHVDALLSHGRGRLPDITSRLRQQVEATLGTGPAQAWFRQERDLDTAIADAITIAADDILLPCLTASLTPEACRLLLAASLYREPVDLNALLYQMGDVDDAAAHVPDRASASRRLTGLLEQQGITIEQAQADSASGEWWSRPASVRHAVAAELSIMDTPPHPPRGCTVDLRALIAEVEATTLLSVVREAGDGGDGSALTVFVHRWTASELIRTTASSGSHAEFDVSAAHGAAAAYWLWRVDVWPQDRRADVHDLLEAQYHYLAADDVLEADAVTKRICSQLHVWGAWDQEWGLVNTMLARLSPDRAERAVWIQQLGILAHGRGNYDAAERWYQQSLTINERLGDQAGIAASYHQLGMLAQDRGDYETAERRYQQSLTIDERLDDQADMAKSYHQLGVLSYLRGDYDAAERWCQQSLTIEEGLGNQTGMAKSYHQLGILAQNRSDYETAERWYQQSLTIDERLDDQAGMANGYHQLGMLAQEHGDYEMAERRYQQSLTIEERLGNQAGMASSWGQLGILAQIQGDRDTAEQRYMRCLAISERLGDRAQLAKVRSQIGFLKQEQDLHAEGLRWHEKAWLARTSMKSPDADVNLHALGKIREVIGTHEFVILSEPVLDGESLATLLQLLDLR